MAARMTARAALGKGVVDDDPFVRPPLKRTPPPAEPGPVWVKSENPIYVLTPGEAAVLLGMSQAELEAMIAAGKVETLGAFAPMIPTHEVDRLRGIKTGQAP